MIITLIKNQSGSEFVRDMEKQYGSLQKIRTAYEKTNNMKLLVDMENWEYYQEHPDETLELSESLVTDNISLSKLDLMLLDVVKHKHPKSIREVAKLIDKNVSNVQPRLKKLEEEGFIQFKKWYKNSLVPYLTYDDIKISIWFII